jgi:hypothetical protein
MPLILLAGAPISFSNRLTVFFPIRCSVRPFRAPSPIRSHSMGEGWGEGTLLGCLVTALVIALPDGFFFSRSAMENPRAESAGKAGGVSP